MRRLVIAVLVGLAFTATDAHAWVRVLPASVVAPKGPLDEGRWPTWNNVDDSINGGSRGISDCTFAAAADWQMMMLGKTPDENSLIRDFHSAGGTDDEGLYVTREEAEGAGLSPRQSLEDWWARRGIDGTRVALKPEPNSRLDVLIYVHRALLAVIANHAVVVAGYNASGPEIITYGETKQTTWAEWRTWGVELYLPVLR